jgi:hypothetical protein
MPAKALDWYDDFVTIVVHPGEAVARRQMVDEAGVVHEHAQALVAIVFIACSVPLPSAGAGSRPGGRLTFFCLAKRK